eukprot:gb/GEZN01004435.1/.p1 GENE.gb/GEZN01004435.1/~~gb/GEZN01004435.1/.p1  ORF type:complete len:430 (-),score=21.94 gb/GEZN01004435.1/:401-1690(-)
MPRVVPVIMFVLFFLVGLNFATPLKTCYATSGETGLCLEASNCSATSFQEEGLCPDSTVCCYNASEDHRRVLASSTTNLSPCAGISSDRNGLLQAAYMIANKPVRYSQGRMRWSGIDQHVCPNGHNYMPAADCSALVSWVYWTAFGNGPDFVNFQGWHAGTADAPGRSVSVKNAVPGDIFLHGRPVNHVTLYMGNGKVLSHGSPNHPPRIQDMCAGFGCPTGVIQHLPPIHPHTPPTDAPPDEPEPEPPVVPVTPPPRRRPRIPRTPRVPRVPVLPLPTDTDTDPGSPTDHVEEPRWKVPQDWPAWVQVLFLVFSFALGVLLSLLVCFGSSVCFCFRCCRKEEDVPADQYLAWKYAVMAAKPENSFDPHMDWCVKVDKTPLDAGDWASPNRGDPAQDRDALVGQYEYSLMVPDEEKARNMKSPERSFGG